jgi:hypothetical protein
MSTVLLGLEAQFDSTRFISLFMCSKLLFISACDFFQGAAIDRIVFEIIRSKEIPGFQFDYVMCLGHFLSKV